MSWEFLQHEFDIDQRVRPAVDEMDWGLDIPGRELGHFVVLRTIPDCEGGRSLIVEHLEGPVTDDLEPMHDALCACERVQVRIGGEFLVRGDVPGLPVEEESERLVDEPGEDGWVEEGLPHCGGAEDGAAAEGEEENLGIGLAEGGDRPRSESWGCHGGGKGDKEVHLFIQCRVDGESGKGLSRALTESDVGEIRLARGLEDVVDRVRDVMEGELVHAKVPEAGFGGFGVDGLLTVFVASVVAEPHVVALFYEDKWETAFPVRKADPHFAVHKQAVVQIDYLLLYTAFSAVHTLSLLALH